MNETTSKFKMSLDFRRVEQQKKLEDRARKDELLKAKREEVTSRAELKKTELLRKIERSNSRQELVSARRRDT